MTTSVLTLARAILLCDHPEEHRARSKPRRDEAIDVTIASERCGSCGAHRLVIHEQPEETWSYPELVEQLAVALEGEPTDRESGALPMPTDDVYTAPGVLSTDARGALALIAAFGAGGTMGVDVAVDRFGVGLIGELVFRGFVDVDAGNAVVLTKKAAPEVAHFDRLREIAEMCTCGRDRGEHLVDAPHATEDGACAGFTLLEETRVGADGGRYGAVDCAAAPASVVVDLASYRASGAAGR